MRTGTGIDAVAPLLEHGGWLRELPRLFEPSDLIWRTPEALVALTRQLAAQGRPLRLERLPADSPTLPALRAAYRGRGLVLCREAMPTPFIDLADCKGQADACLSPRRRADLRRAARRAGQLGLLEYSIHAPTNVTELDTLLTAALAVESRSWKVATGTALTTAHDQGAFFTHFTHAALAEGMLRFAFLHIDGHPVAMQIACQWQQRFWLLKISHDQTYADCSPGQLLIAHTLANAARQGLASYEFMGVMAPWTSLWTRQARQYVDVRAIPFHPLAARSLLGQALRAARARLRSR